MDSIDITSKIRLPNGPKRPPRVGDIWYALPNNTFTQQHPNPNEDAYPSQGGYTRIVYDPIANTRTYLFDNLFLDEGTGYAWLKLIGGINSPNEARPRAGLVVSAFDEFGRYWVAAGTTQYHRWKSSFPQISAWFSAPQKNEEPFTYDLRDIWGMQGAELLGKVSALTNCYEAATACANITPGEELTVLASMLREILGLTTEKDRSPESWLNTVKPYQITTAPFGLRRGQFVEVEFSPGQKAPCLVISDNTFNCMQELRRIVVLRLVKLDLQADLYAAAAEAGIFPLPEESDFSRLISEAFGSGWTIFTPLIRAVRRGAVRPIRGTPTCEGTPFLSTIDTHLSKVCQCPPNQT